MRIALDRCIITQVDVGEIFRYFLFSIFLNFNEFTPKTDKNKKLSSHRNVSHLGDFYCYIEWLSQCN